MKNFIIAVGHTASGTKGCGVISRLNESNCTREICALLFKNLKMKGHNVYLLRVDYGNTYNYEDCYVRVNEANKIFKTKEVNLYVEIHINAGGGAGTEVCITGKSDYAKAYAEKVSSRVSNSLGIRNRGVKIRSLIVLNRTIIPAILVECLFADSDDAAKYNPDKIANAICDALCNTNDTTKEWKLGWNENNIGWWYCTDLNNKYYYTSKNGWQHIDNEWYTFDKDGYALCLSWYFDENKKSWYYLDKRCKRVTGTKDKPLWLWIDGFCYAFDEEGKMYYDCITSDGFEVDKNGAWIK